MTEHAAWMDDNRTRTYDDGGVSADWEMYGREAYEAEGFDTLKYLRLSGMITESEYWLRVLLDEGAIDEETYWQRWLQLKESEG